jgi:outer membrane immunogenic protein
MRQLMGAAALVLVCNSAVAADLADYTTPYALPPVREAFSWTGFYLGVSGGFGFNEDDPSYSYGNVPSNVIPLLPTSAKLDADGGLIGGTLGYNKQFGEVVLGVEGDFSGTDFGETAVHNVPGDASIGFPPLKFRTAYQMDWLSTVRGRAGVAFDRWLLYGTAGLAFAKVSLDSSVTVGKPPLGQLTGSEDTTKSGWTAGGGGAVAITPHISLKAEALYYDLGDITVRSTNPQQDSVLSTDQSVNGVIVRGGIDYRF